MTLYEPAFAVAARRATGDPRSAITALTLWGGFASTVFVPLTQHLINGFRWRGALLALAALNVAICIPLHLAVVERGSSARYGRLLRHWIVAHARERQSV